MVGVELGACEWFVWDLRRSNLVDRTRLEELVNLYLERHPQAEPLELADYLVQQRLLTRFQADSTLAGKSNALVLGPYTLQDTLGAGSMGTVYKAHSRNASGLFAVKVLPRRSMWNIRLARRKVRDFESFEHPAVVPFVDVGTAGGMHYLVWPFVEGQTLEAYVKSRGALPPFEAATYARQVAEGLAICHSHDLIHGLLKPSNLLLSPNHQVRILDFGVGSLLAQTESESVVDTMSTANTMASGLDCASPEGIMDPTTIGPASDQYSLGCTLFYLLTGQFPFPGDNAVEKMMAHQTRQPPSVQELVAGVPDGLAKIVERLLQKQPGARYPSALDLVVALRPFAQDVHSDSMPWKQPAHKLGGLNGLPPPPRSHAPVQHRSGVERPAPLPLPAAGQAVPARSSPSTGAMEWRPVAAAPAAEAAYSPAAPTPPVSAPQVVPAHPAPARPVRPTPVRAASTSPAPKKTVEDSLGTFGMVLLTVIVGAAAFAITWFLR